jgi:hypothetical protein
MGNWPLPKDESERLRVLMRLLLWINDTPYKIMIRKHKFAYAGIIENTNMQRFDSQYGRNMAWLSGWKSNGGNHRNLNLVAYDEPRMHKMPVTGELKDTILMETDMFILCARDSEGLDNDLDGFTYDASDNELKQHARMILQIDTLNASVMDLEDKVNEHMMESERNLALASDYGARVKKAESESRRLREYNFELEEQVQGLLRERKLLTIKSREDESEISMKEQNAGEIGQLRGMTEAQIMSEAVDKHNEISSKLEEVSSQPGHQGSYAEMKKTLGNLEKEIKSMKDNKTENADKKEAP